MSPYHVLAKPVGSACNLDCTYCYYKRKERPRGDDRMQENVLQAFVRQHLAACTGDRAVFTWHGGEPTMAGLEFFQRAVELQRQMARPGVSVQNDLQTNGLLLDDAWCTFLKQNDFLVGLSVDGPADLHDACRRDARGNPSHAAAIRAAALLREHGVPFNVLTVVNRLSAARPLDVYHFLTRDLQATHIQFLPCVEPRDEHLHAQPDWQSGPLPDLHSEASRPGGADSFVTPYSVDPLDWGRFLIAVFDHWRQHDAASVSVSLFDSLLGQWVGRRPRVCVLSAVCGQALALEAEGDVYSCDRYVFDSFRLGSILETPLSELAANAGQLAFGAAKSAELCEMCQACPYLFACNGDCPRHRFVRTGKGDRISYLCPGMRLFLTHVQPYLARR